MKLKRKFGKEIIYNEAGMILSEEYLVEIIELFEKTRAGGSRGLFKGPCARIAI